MAVTVRCKACGKKLRSEDHFGGKRVKCPNCSSPIIFPKSDPAQTKTTPERDRQFRHPNPDQAAQHPSPKKAVIFATSLIFVVVVLVGVFWTAFGGSKKASQEGEVVPSNVTTSISNDAIHKENGNDVTTPIKPKKIENDKPELNDGRPRLSLQKVLSFHKDSAVVSLCFSTDGRFLASGSRDRQLLMWNIPQDENSSPREFSPSLRTGNMLHDPLDDVRISPDGETVVVGAYRSATIYEMSSGLELKVFHQHSRVAFDPVSNLLALRTYENVILYDIAKREEVKRISVPLNAVFGPIAISPDRGLLAITEKWVMKNDLNLQLIDINTGKFQKETPIHTVEAIAFSPNSKLLACLLSRDREIHVYDISSGEVRRFTGTGFGGLVFHPNGTLLASGGQNAFHFWDIESGKVRYTSPRQDTAVFSVAFSPKGDLLATGHLEGKIKLWVLEN